MRKFDPTETRNRSGREAGDAEGRWANIVENETELYKGLDMSKVQLLPMTHVRDLNDAIERNLRNLGPIRGVLNIVGDSGQGGDEITKRGAKCDVSVALTRNSGPPRLATRSTLSTATSRPPPL